MERFGSIRFEGTLGPAERESAARVLSSAGVAVTSWNGARGAARTYASLRLPDDFATATLPPGLQAIDEPAAIVVEFDVPAGVARSWLRDALTGPGRPAGILDALESNGRFLVELEGRATTLRTLVDLIRVEAGAQVAIVPLLGLDDATLSAFAGATLGIAGLGVAALLETYSEPLLGGTV